eukprot:gene40011-54094_t
MPTGSRAKARGLCGGLRLTSTATRQIDLARPESHAIPTAVADDNNISALDRIDRAITRIESIVKGQAEADAALSRRHEALRHRVSQAIATDPTPDGRCHADHRRSPPHRRVSGWRGRPVALGSQSVFRAALGSQSVFRAALHALSHPGRVVELPHDAQTPSRGHAASAALLLALLDPDCTLWLSPSLAGSDAAAWLRFHRGCVLIA